jgi:phosphoribosylamine--glycine ligase
MNILLLGSGGREHALAQKIVQSQLCQQLFIAPGNAGTQQCGTNLPFSATDFESIKQSVVLHGIQMIVVGPEDPLVKGIYDFIKNDPETAHVQVIGPSASAARLEGSKAFAKAFMSRHHIPTAAYREFTADNFDEGVTYILQHSLPVVLKADGLAAGKGVLICATREEAVQGFTEMIRESKFGAAGNKVVIESCLRGIEVSVFVVTDGNEYLILPEAKDYKRIGVGDTGLNTGGMGAVSPVPFFDEALRRKIEDKIVKPTVDGLSKEGMVYKGFIFLGLMIDNGDPYMIEYNCRMGDPETEVVIPRIKSDLVEMFVCLSSGMLADYHLEMLPDTAVTTIIVSGGYPGDYSVGKKISGHELAMENLRVYHCGTKTTDTGVVTNGGRVMAITAFGNDIATAAALSRKGVANIEFEGCYHRNDIGYEFV